MAKDDPLAPAGFLAQALKNLVSSTEALRMYREGGGHIQTQRWYRLAGEVRAALDNRSITAFLDPSLVPSADRWTAWTMKKPGLYYYQIDVLQWHDPLQQYVTSPFTVAFLDPLPPEQAIDEALAVYDVEGQSSEGMRVVGGVLTGLYQSVAKQ